MIPSLPGHDPDPAGRARDLSAARDALAYAYDRPAGVAMAASVPRRLGFPLGVIAQATEARAAVAANDAARRVLRGEQDTSATSTAESCRASFVTLRAPRIADITDVDRLFAWHRVGGPNPFVLRRAERPPDGLDLRGADVPRGALFVADYAVLDGIAAGSWQGAAKRLPAPVALFAVVAGELVPVAIRADRSAGAPTVTPRDGRAWELARLAVQAADANVHESFLHLGRAHFLLEAIAMATERQLSARHPLHVLLSPHFEGTLAINGSARDQLVVAGGQLDQLMAATLDGSLDLVRKGLSSFVLKDAIPSAELRLRGVDDRDVLPVYPWRDEAVPLWDAVRRFVDGYVRLSYASDADVAGDVEVRAWADEIGADDGGRLPGFGRPTTLAELVDAVAFVVFQASAGHAALNYSQEDFLAWVPTMPTATYAASSDVAWAGGPPSIGQADAQVGFMVAQSRVRVNRLGQYPRGQFADPRVDAPLAALQSDLAAIESGFADRDAARLVSYPYLRPSLLTASIHI